MAVVSVLGVLWLAFMLVVLLRSRPWARADWAPLRLLTGERAQAVEGLAHSLMLRVSLVDRGAELSRQARARGSLDQAGRLAETALGVADMIVPQLHERVGAWRGHARVLQEAVATPLLDGRPLRWRPLRLLAQAERLLLALPLTRPLRLRAHLLLLSLSLKLLGWRLRRLARRGRPAEPVQADLAELSRAVVAGYETLLLSLQATRARIEVLRRQR